MAKFCGKCGSKLDEATGLCPNCDADKLNKQIEKPEEVEMPGQERDTAPEPKKSLSKKEAKKQRKADKKAKKKEKMAQWSIGKKIRRFFLKLILTVLLLAMLATAIAGALVYFDVMNIPYISSIIGKLKAENQNAGIAFNNGDYVFTPTEEHIAYDVDSNMLYFNNQLIVYTFSELSEDEAVKLAELVDGEIVGRLSGSINALQIRVKISTLDELKSMSTLLMNHTDVLYAGYDYPMQLSPVEVDSNPWSSNRSNPIVGRSEESNPEGNDWWAEAIGAYTAWNYSDECRPIKVGIIDSGFDAEHEDLSGRITFLQDYSANSEGNHGTHVAGIIGANNNIVGIRGIADSADLICVDWSPTDSISYLSTGEYIEIIKQLVENDTRVINNSWGNYFLSKDGYTQYIYGKDGDLKYLLEYLAVHTTGAYDSYVEYCEAVSDRTGLECTIIMIQLMLNGYDDFLIVQSAGNGKDNGGPGVDAHYNSFFCAIDADIYNILSESVRNTLSHKGIDYNAIDERILVVGAVENNCDTRGYRMSQYSNFGSNVDICAPGGKGGNNPGKNIFSTLVDSNYGELCGTSMAAPMVTGSAAFIWSLNPELSAPKVRDILLTNTRVQAYGVGDGASYTYPMLNVGTAAEAVVSDMMSNFDKGDVPDEAVEYNGHYYYVYNLNTVTTWEEAKKYCESQGGYLATITSQEENEFVYNYLRNNFDYESAYFGFTDRDEEGTWVWDNGEVSSYTNWHSGEPNSENPNEDFAMYDYKYSDGSWNDGDFCHRTENSGRAFICEWGEYQTASNSQSQEPIRTTSNERDIVLVLDTSGSMSGSPMEETKKAATNFVDTILEEDASIGIVTYEDSAERLSNFSVDKNHLTGIVAGISSGGETNIESGLAEAKSMLDSSNAKKKIIVLMSDGEPNEGKEGDELIAYADAIKNDDILIYTLGFFENMGVSKSSAQYLMEHLASEGCHYEVASADDLVFFFEDMADQINGQKYIYIRIACPVDVTVTYNGETLCSAEDDLAVRTDFGTLTFEDSENEISANADDRIKVLRLKEGADYDVQIVGTGRGMMDYTIGFMDENGDYSDFRRFKNIKITKQTVIDTVAAVSDESVLNIDEDGDGKYDLRLRAEENGYGEEIKIQIWFYIGIGGGTVLLIIGTLVVVKKRKNKKEGMVKS